MDSDYLLITSKSIIHWVLEFFKYPFAFSILNIPKQLPFTARPATRFAMHRYGTFCSISRRLPSLPNIKHTPYRQILYLTANHFHSSLPCIHIKIVVLQHQILIPVPNLNTLRIRLCPDDDLTVSGLHRKLRIFIPEKSRQCEYHCGTGYPPVILKRS